MIFLKLLKFFDTKTTILSVGRENIARTSMSTVTRQGIQLTTLSDVGVHDARPLKMDFFAKDDQIFKAPKIFSR